MRDLLFRYEKWRDNNTEHYWKQWYPLLEIFIGLAVYLVLVYIFKLSIYVAYGATMLILLSPGLFFSKPTTAKKLSPKMVTALTLTVALGLVVVSVFVSLRDSKPAFSFIPGGVEFDNGISLLIIPLLLLLFMGPYIVSLYVVAKAVEKRTRIKSISKKKLFR